LALGKKAVDRAHPGTTELSRLEENLGATSVELSIEDMRALEEASSAIKVEGECHPATHAKLIDRSTEFFALN
jgi:aryl-alcohol dehydrogenase-like predicted oxidoreductase